MAFPITIEDAFDVVSHQTITNSYHRAKMTTWANIMCALSYQTLCEITIRFMEGELQAI